MIAIDVYRYRDLLADCKWRYSGVARLGLAALMNAVYLHFPEYAAQHNLAEQAGLNNGLAQLLHTQGIDLEPRIDPERFLSLSAQAGTAFIDF